MLRTYMARWNDPNAYAVSHIGWGMDEKALWDFLATSPLAAVSTGADGRAFYGNVLFSTGPNSELGGTNDTACHLDIPLRHADLYLDGAPIVLKGDIVPAELRAAQR
jgi:2,5-dihydroxypyridine 5,6-dioxygenase